ncbi:uncharacterized protein YALI1_D12523g [Yarrowia lipolytica]|uniref:Uncharacterized protein n=1 Tax=Yarrowia lipolytica TaxID=4952 RepID=A0A1D8NDY1_YARLL|nr:hypothetical protein YALI1_D12523g [Yarrowia lipolytica]
MIHLLRKQWRVWSSVSNLTRPQLHEYIAILYKSCRWKRRLGSCQLEALAIGLLFEFRNGLLLLVTRTARRLKQKGREGPA